jgi:hypothetical protein
MHTEKIPILLNHQYYSALLQIKENITGIKPKTIYAKNIDLDNPAIESIHGSGG